nr:putative disease resistance protein At1g50180 [Coffea arabica]
MDGIGKTTLAQKVYGDSSVHRHFDCFAWASVGKDFRTRRILLQHVCRARDDMASFPDLDLAQKLYEFLQSKRFLIALDDVWSADAWECPPRCIFVSRTNRQQSAAHRSPLGTTELRRRFLLHQPRTFSPSAFFFTVVPSPSLSNSQPPFFFF